MFNVVPTNILMSLVRRMKSMRTQNRKTPLFDLRASLLKVINLFSVKKIGFLGLFILLIFQQTAFTKPLVADPAWQTQKLENGFTWQVLQATHRSNDPIEIRLVINTGSMTETLEEKGFIFTLLKMALLQDNGLPLLQLNQFNNPSSMPLITFSYDSVTISLSVPNNNPEQLKTAIHLLSTLVKENNLSTELALKQLDDNSIKLFTTRPQNTLDGFWLNRIKDSSLVGFDPVLSTPFNIKLDKLIEFHQKWFTPDAMNLFVVGKVDIRALTQSINKSFSELSGVRQKPAPVAILQPLEAGAMAFSQPDLDTPVLSLYWDASWYPINASKDYDKWWRLELGREVIFTRINNKLNIKANDSLKLNLECNVLFMRQLCVMNLSQHNNNNLSTSFNKIVAELHDLQEVGIKDDEFKALIETKNTELSNLFATYAHTDLSKLVDNRIHAQQNGIVDISLEQYQQLRQSFLSSVTLDEVNEAVEYFLSRPVTIVLRQPEGNNEQDPAYFYQKYIDEIKSNQSSVKDGEEIVLPSTDGTESTHN